MEKVMELEYKEKKEYKPCLFSLFTLSLTIRMQIGECPEALGSLFCSVTMHVISYCNIWTPDQSLMEVNYAFRKQHTIQSTILYSHTHPQCITSLGYTGNPIYNHYSYSRWFQTQRGLILSNSRYNICLSNLLFFFKRVSALSLMKPMSQQDFNQVYMQGWKIEAWFCHFEKKKTVIKRKNIFTKQKRKSIILFTSW